ncbi:hypothetical protein GOP47_0005629 [Adiantum capillus-veneris]|uniref:Zinc finger, RING/FYVE/PHD-type n=1 Tax=Adiantum capillus-veneris TaxID=13818 RepID=A0A9D4V632_ADICA|nr:hypothetical protein GOP47_0005629 [Adiantum capillus-veneris]
MPKDKRSGRSAPLKSRSCPYKGCGKGREGDNAGDQDRKEDWEDALCPICLESPHNAVLLMCSSHADGCRPYMCNTSHIHSNCLDQYQKTQAGLQKSHGPRQAFSSEHAEHSVADSLYTADGLNMRIVGAYPIPSTRRTPRVSATVSSEHALGARDMENAIIEAMNSRLATAGSDVFTRRSRRNTHLPLLTRNEISDAGMQFSDLESSMEMDSFEGLSSGEEHGTGASLKSKHLICPLCRGQIFGWRVINAARKYFNDKPRSCSHESCMFSGTYQELRVHARCEHPFTRPCDVDPVRQRDWLRMERQREIGDVLSTIGGVANEDMVNDDGRWWSSFFLLHSTIPLVYDGQLRDHYQLLSSRAGSARLREFVGSISHGADGLNNASGSRNVGAETANSIEGQVRRQLRPRGI